MGEDSTDPAFHLGLRSRLRHARGTALELIYYCFPKLVYSMRVRGNDNYEEHMELLPALCRGDRLSLDVGGKTGMYTRRIIEQSSETVTFEPIPVLAHVLRSVFGGRVRIENVALSDRAGTAELRTPFGLTGKPRYGLSTIEAGNHLLGPEFSRVREVTVPIQRLDDYAFSEVGFIKIDVEGHEMSVLRGARETIKRDRPNVLIEAQEEHHADAVSQVHEWFQELGYHGFFLRHHRLISIDKFDPGADGGREGIENFMFIHRGRPEVEQRLRELVAARARLPVEGEKV